jgi:hypothetical protein
MAALGEKERDYYYYSITFSKTASMAFFVSLAFFVALRRLPKMPKAATIPNRGILAALAALEAPNHR